MIGFIIAANGTAVVDRFSLGNEQPDANGWSIIHRPRGILYEAWYTVIRNERLPTNERCETEEEGTISSACVLRRFNDGREGLRAKLLHRYVGRTASFNSSKLAILAWGGHSRHWRWNI